MKNEKNMQKSEKKRRNATCTVVRKQLQNASSKAQFQNVRMKIEIFRWASDQVLLSGPGVCVYGGCMSIVCPTDLSMLSVCGLGQ